MGISLLFNLKVKIRLGHEWVFDAASPTPTYKNIGS